jgi:hypothetical protein
VSAVLPEAALVNAASEAADGSAAIGDDLHLAGTSYELIGRSVVVLERVS